MSLLWEPEESSPRFPDIMSNVLSPGLSEERERGGGGGDEGALILSYNTRIWKARALLGSRERARASNRRSKEGTLLKQYLGIYCLSTEPLVSLKRLCSFSAFSFSLFLFLSLSHSPEPSNLISNERARVRA